jgi:hypothetical protein
MKISKRQLRKIIKEAMSSPAAGVAQDFLANYPEINSEDSYYDLDADNMVVDYAESHGVDPDEVKDIIMKKLGMTF